MTLEEIDARIEKLNRDLAETSARLQGYTQEMERLNKHGFMLQGAINELNSIRAKVAESNKSTEEQF